MDPALSRSVEDVDLCRRVRDAGYRVDFDPGIDALRHAAEVPGDGSAGGARALRRTLRNNVRYCAKHYGRGWALLVRLALGPICLLRAAGLFLRGLLPGANTCLHRARVFAELGAALLSGGPGAGLLRQAPTTPSASAHSTRGARPDREPATLEEPGGSGGSGGEPGL
jgi:GT2 family glycosyltransferase